jgi:pyrroline-5-carboxylate reductase
MGAQQLAILGGGHMGRALISGLLRHGARPEDLTVADLDGATRASLTREFAVRACEDARAAVRGADTVVIAVKPQHVAGLLAPLRATLNEPGVLLISVAAGIRLASLRQWCGEEVAMVRAMPNCAALVGAGVSGLFAAPDVPEAVRAAAARVLSAVGEIVWLQQEDALDVVTALSGSGPAYFFTLAESMMQAAVELGLDAAAARKLAVGTLYGVGLIAHASDGDLGSLRAAVTSKGGTTEAALRVFAAADLSGITLQAMQAAARRSRELAGQFG